MSTQVLPTAASLNTRGPWTAMPALIKIHGKGQINQKSSVTNIDAIFRKTANCKTQKAVHFVFLITWNHQEKPSFEQETFTEKSIFET